MKYPIDREKFVERWHRDIRRECEREPDAGDTEFAEALVRCMNDAYYAGVADGGKLSENSGGGYQKHPHSKASPDQSAPAECSIGAEGRL